MAVGHLQVVTLVAAVSLGGCLTPSARYTRPSHRKPSTSYAGARAHAPQKLPAGKPRTHGTKLAAIVESYIGVPYSYGGTTRSGMDCSGFVWRVLSQAGYDDFPRTSAAKMIRLGRPVPERSAREGDLVFFRRRGRISHVGIYLGKGRFAHAASKRGVVYSSMDERYFRRRYAGMRRIQQ